MELMPGYKQSEVGVIPDDWELTPFVALGSVIDGDRGANYPGSRDFSSDGHCLFLNAANVTKAGFRFRECAFISREKDERLSKGKLKRDDIVLTTRGTVGNFAHYDATVSFENIRINSGMVVLRNDSAALDTSFLYVFAQSNLMERQIERLTFGSAQPQLTVKGINELSIVVPSITEQRAIAQALSDVDALLATLDQVIAKKRDLKQATMQQLLTGETRLPGFSGNWEVKQLGDIGQFLKGRGVKKDEAQSGTLPCIRYGEIYTHHNDYIKSFNSWISPQVAVTATKLKQGDLLFAGSGETKEEIGKCVAFIDDCEAYAGGDTVILRAAGINPMFMGYYCNTAPIAAQKASKGQGDAVVHISAAALSSIVLALPSLPEQNAIATALSSMDSELSMLVASRDKTRNLKQAMMQELLTGKTRLV